MLEALADKSYLAEAPAALRPWEFATSWNCEQAGDLHNCPKVDAIKVSFVLQPQVMDLDEGSCPDCGGNSLASWVYSGTGLPVEVKVKIPSEPVDPGVLGIYWLAYGSVPRRILDRVHRCRENFFKSSKY